jgi:hypothetical protein
MFCPLCHAEYREGFTVCSTCRAALVAADAPESERTPPRLKWESHDQRASDAVFSKLYEAGIACLEKVRRDDFFSVAVVRKRPVVTLYILERDADAARKAAGVEFVPDRPAVEIPEGAPVQDCPYCSAKFPAGNTLCPACGGDLLAWDRENAEASQSSLQARPSEAPPADVEPPHAQPDEGEAEMVWRGGDPVIFSRAEEVLRESGVVHHTNQTAQHLAFGEGMPRPRLEILVGAADAERARELVAQFQDSFPLLPQEPFAPAGVDSELPTEDPNFRPRLTKLRWGVGLFVLALVLVTWVVRSGPLTFYSSSQLFSPAYGQIRLIAVWVLYVSSIIANLSSLVMLFVAWAGKRDKVGLLSLFFGIQGVILLGSIYMLIRF